jgi:hypothetical protein
MRGKQRNSDDIDHYCVDWARQRRIALGIINAKMIEPRERLGQLKCTLGKVRSEREGASYSRVNQNFPEVYVGMSLVVHRAYSIMPGEQRMAMHLHYVWREVSVADKCGEIPVSAAGFWTLVGNVKSFLRGYVYSAEPQSHRLNRLDTLEHAF